MKTRHIFAICILLASVFGASYKTIKLYPSKEIKANPFKGWITWWENQSVPAQPVSLAHIYISWKEMEPEKDKYKFDEWEKKNLDYWTGVGVKGVIRLHCDYPRHSEPEADVPDYILEGSKTGYWYKTPSIGNGYAPDLEDPFVVERLSNLIRQLGGRYNDDPRIAWVEVGTIGHWGEWHNWPQTKENGGGPSGKKITGELKAAVSSWYELAFPDKYRVVRYFIPYNTNDAKTGFYDDSFVKQTICDDGPWCTLFNIKKLGLQDRWQTALHEGEFPGGGAGAEDYCLNKTELTLDTIRKFHVTALGPASPANLQVASVEDQEKLDRLYRALGYHFSASKAEYPVKAETGEEVSLSITLSNAGSAPFYMDWPLKLLFKKGVKNAAAVELKADLLTWRPGNIDLKETIIIPKDIEPGKYKLALAIVDPETGESGVHFANMKVTTKGALKLGTVKISK